MAFLQDLISGSNYPSSGSYEFKSSDHIRYQNGMDVSGHNYNCHRTVKIEKNISGNKGYTVTVFNDDGAILYGAVMFKCRQNQWKLSRRHLMKLFSEVMDMTNVH